MTAELRQKISALLDDDLTRGERSSLLGKISTDLQARETWERYHLIGDAIRGEPVNLAARDISARVSRQLMDEPTVLSPGFARKRVFQPSRWQTPLAGAAIAAGVAALTVILLPQLQTRDAPIQATATVASQAVQPALQPTVRPTFVTAGDGQWKNLSEPEMQSRLNRYLIDHSEFASSQGMKGVLPYASFVTYDRSSR